ncbi:MAG: hypothetical protein FWH10_00320 [Oscillospiraceae bacterium]|nr:hypothetical protein [Oscillospiraceae bacterium]
MRAYEFQTFVHNGIIPIPDEYKKKIISKIKVIVLTEESVPDKKSLFPDFTIDTTGYKFDREEANER